jgi:hypothetical protein
VRQKLAYLLGGVALGLALVRLLRRRRFAATARDESDPRAEALREKLARSRAGGPSREQPTETAAEPSPPAESVDAARERVHRRARAAADEMRRSGGD